MRDPSLEKNDVSTGKKRYSTIQIESVHTGSISAVAHDADQMYVYVV